MHIKFMLYINHKEIKGFTSKIAAFRFLKNSGFVKTNTGMFYKLMKNDVYVAEIKDIIDGIDLNVSELY